MATGTATLDFGSTDTNQATVTVTGQSGILSGSSVEAFYMGDTTSDHNAYEHSMAGREIGLVCGNIVAGIGFDIVGTSLHGVHGSFTVHWVWV